MNKLIEKFKNEKRWVNYKLAEVEGRTTKVPYSPITKRKASSTKESDWGTYTQAFIADAKQIGIVFTPDKKLLGIDLDHCLNEKGLVTDETIMEFISEASTYIEKSPSETGLHLYLELTEGLSLEANRSGNVECYTESRYFTVTENVYDQEQEIRTVTTEEAIRLITILGYPWKKKKDVEVIVDETLSDDEILDKMFASKNGAKLKSLYEGDTTNYKGDDSAADLALCNALAFWSGKSAEQMERIWVASPIGNREKTQKRKDYRKVTIQTAINSCTETYTKKSSDDIDFEFLYKIKGKQKNITLCAENILKVLQLHPSFMGKFRWDNFTMQIDINIGGNWVQFEDKHIIDTQCAIAREFVPFQTVSKDMTYDAILKVAHENAMDSAIDYLKGLEWDGTPRLDTWLCEAYGVENDEYHRAVGANWMKGLVQRIVYPGCKFDYVLVLEGPQGSKKSTSLMYLGGDWHVETTMSTDSKDFFMQFSAKPIIEFSEGETLSRTEVKRMKAIITTQNDKFRAPYDRVSKDHPRRCVFAMTTNSSEYLKDETGNRRWLPVALVFEYANLEWLKQNRDQLFAEAYKRAIVDKEKTYEFPEEATREAQNSRRISDPNTELVVDWYFDSLDDKQRAEGITVLQVFMSAYNNNMGSKEMKKHEEMAIANILKDVLKLERTRVMRNGMRAIRWYQKGVEMVEPELNIDKKYVQLHL